MARIPGWLPDALTLSRLALLPAFVLAVEAGWYEGGVRNVLVTRTPTFANEADVIGLYADVRAAGILGNADNFRIALIPEPSAAALLGFGALAGVMMRRRRQ